MRSASTNAVSKERVERAVRCVGAGDRRVMDRSSLMTRVLENIEVM